VRLLRALLPLLSLLCGAPLACTGGNVASHLAQTPRFEPEGEARCAVVKSQAHPLVVEWPSADRLTLENKLREGLVAVRYQGCEMRVLERCSAPGRYTYLGATRSEDKVVIKDEDDLYANLPLGAAKLEAKLQRSGELTVDLDLVGRYEAEKLAVRADELAGDCRGATHFVYGVAVGAFDFHAGADATVGAGAGFGGVGASGASQSERETLKKSGDTAACTHATLEDKAPPEGCGALVRLEVVPLGAPRPIVPSCPDGATWNGSACLATRHVTEVACPEGTSWDGAACTTTRVVTRVECPAGAWWSGTACAAKVQCPDRMAWLQGGRFATSGGYADFDPADGIAIQPFCMDTTEVTVDAYAACVKAGRCGAQGLQVVTDRRTLKVDPLCSYGAKDEGDHPVNCVTWGQASAYCHAQGKRLPSEWEWEWAALGAVDPSLAVKRPDPAPTCVGPSLAAPKSWGAGQDSGAAVGTCAVSEGSDAGPEGVRGLYGNVAEWTSSRLPWAGMVARGASWRDPKNATVGLLNYSHDEVMASTAARNAYAPGTRRDDLGFRCVK
jgi:formylglycine-generating enzyme required for sulfatase activity